MSANSGDHIDQVAEILMILLKNDPINVMLKRLKVMKNNCSRRTADLEALRLSPFICVEKDKALLQSIKREYLALCNLYWHIEELIKKGDELSTNVVFNNEIEFLEALFNEYEYPKLDQMIIEEFPDLPEACDISLTLKNKVMSGNTDIQLPKELHEKWTGWT